MKKKILAILLIFIIVLQISGVAYAQNTNEIQFSESPASKNSMNISLR